MKKLHLAFKHVGAADYSARCESLTARCNRLPQKRFGGEDTEAKPYAGLTTENRAAVTCRNCLAQIAFDDQTEAMGRAAIAAIAVAKASADAYESHRSNAAKRVAEHNTASTAMLKLIADLLPTCGTEANWGHAGTAGHVRQQLREILTGLAIRDGESEAAAHGRLEAEALAANG